jgi:hypothetical protein
MRNTLDAARLRARAAAIDGLRLPDRASRAAAARRGASDAFEAAWAARRSEVDRAGAIACAAGCATCCHQHVAVALVEAVAIADVIAGDTRLARRVAEAAPRIGSLTALERRRARIPCPFLEADGRCGIYETRPIRCRGVHSRDVELCRSQTEFPDAAAAERAVRHEVPHAFPLVPVHIADAALTGLALAQQDAGIATDTLELVTALGLLLRHPERAKAAMAGLDDLAEARLDPDARPVAAMDAPTYNRGA